jgi:hypothetical protein
MYASWRFNMFKPWLLRAWGWGHLHHLSLLEVQNLRVTGIAMYILINPQLTHLHIKV